MSGGHMTNAAMTFEELLDFLQSRMRLSHVYQPLLIKSLVEAGGTATVRQLAFAFLGEDESQIQYYEKRIKEMPVKVLSKHGVVVRDGELVKLTTGKLSFEQKAQVRMICEQKLHEYVAARGLAIWDHRFLDTEPVSDVLRYRVLRESGGRCAMCGVTKKESPLDVDHIIPRSKGGKTVYENLQVLCVKCNRSKGNKDKTDFRQVVMGEPQEGCVFCEDRKRPPKLPENDLAFMLLDGYPVTEGHTLIIPKRHTADYFDLTEVERIAIDDLLCIRRSQLVKDDPTIEGCNFGVNCGEVAGQTIFHCHVHLIPRRKGDVHDPRGGVRKVIRGKGRYPFDSQ